jgi:hypothetical protein
MIFGGATWSDDDASYVWEALVKIISAKDLDSESRGDIFLGFRRQQRVDPRRTFQDQENFFAAIELARTLAFDPREVASLRIRGIEAFVGLDLVGFHALSAVLIADANTPSDLKEEVRQQLNFTSYYATDVRTQLGFPDDHGNAIAKWLATHRELVDVWRNGNADRLRQYYAKP